MALVLKDRVKETSITAGTGAMVLAGTSTGFQPFSVIGNGNTTYYTIYDSTTGAWEVGTGTYTSSSNSLSRDSVFASTNAGNLVDFAANSKDVFVAYPAEEAVTLDSAQTLSNKTLSNANLGTPTAGVLTNATGLPLTTGVTSVLLEANGGTGESTYTNGQLLIGNAAGGLTKATLTAGTGVTITNGDGTITINAPEVGTVTSVTASAPLASSGGNTPNISLTGTVAIANGGTNSTATPTAGGVAYGNGTAYALTSAGTAGQYLQSSGSGAPAWSSISSGVGSTAYYGAFQDTTDQTIASTTTAYVVNIGITDEANGVSITSGNRITYANAGTYALTYSIQLENANTSIQDVDIWVRKNGTDLTDSNSQFSVTNKHGGTNGHLIAVCNYVFTLAAGDYLQICWAATSTDISIQTYPAQTSPTRPLTPGVIVTTSQLTQIGIGYYGLTSSSSVAIGTGNKTFTTNLDAMNTAFTVGSRVRVAYTTTPTNFMEGNITAFSGTSMTVNVDVTGGSGTYAAWSFTSVGSAGVTSISGGTTGLTPATATTGAVTLAGTVATTNGGTGLTSFTSGGAVYATSTSALTTGTLPIASGGTGATDAATARANLGAGTGNGTVTSVGGTGTVNGITLTGTVTSSGSLTLGGTLSGVSLTTQVSGTLPVANGGTGLTAGTSGGVLYYSAAGTLASSAAFAANALVVGGGAGVAPSTITTGTGVVTALGVNTGSSGAFVVNGGALGTPSSGTLTNATGLPISSGVSGLGTGVATALAVNTGSSGAVVVNGGALGTPSSGTLSSCTADGTNPVGFKNIPQSGSDKTSSYTLATTDVGKFIGVGTGGSIIVPNSTFATGDVVSIFNNTSGNITITTNPTSSYIAGTNTTKASVTLATRGVATILFISGTVCTITGNVT